MRGDLTNQIKTDLIKYGVVDIPLDPAGSRSDTKLRSAREAAYQLVNRGWVSEQYPGQELVTSVTSDDSGRYLTISVR